MDTAAASSVKTTAKVRMMESTRLKLFSQLLLSGKRRIFFSMKFRMGLSR